MKKDDTKIEKPALRPPSQYSTKVPLAQFEPPKENSSQNLFDAIIMREIAKEARIRFAKEQIQAIINLIKIKTEEGKFNCSYFFTKEFDDTTISTFVIELRNKGYKVGYSYSKDRIEIEWY